MTAKQFKNFIEKHVFDTHYRIEVLDSGDTIMLRISISLHVRYGMDVAKREEFFANMRRVAEQIQLDLEDENEGGSVQLISDNSMNRSNVWGATQSLNKDFYVFYSG